MLQKVTYCCLVPRSKGMDLHDPGELLETLFRTALRGLPLGIFSDRSCFGVYVLVLDSKGVKKWEFLRSAELPLDLKCDDQAANMVKPTNSIILKDNQLCFCGSVF